MYKDEKLFSAPGTRWRYSNAGYSLLGAIVERLSGKPYLEYVRENIFRPLGMRDTYTDPGGKAARKISVFYTQSPLDPLGLEPYVADRALGGARPTGFGGGFSTAPDMLKFLRAFRTGKLLGGEMTQKVAEGKFNLDDKGARRWAYGMSESVVNGETVRGHQGGSRADVQMLWQSGYTVIVLLNAIPPPVNAVSNDIAAFITSQMRARRTVTAPACKSTSFHCKPGYSSGRIPVARAKTNRTPVTVPTPEITGVAAPPSSNPRFLPSPARSAR